MERNIRLLIMVTIAAIGLSSISGCSNQRKLFPEESYSTQYHRYESTHGNERALTRTTAFGREEPNIRERLRPLKGP